MKDTVVIPSAVYDEYQRIAAEVPRLIETIRYLAAERERVRPDLYQVKFSDQPIERPRVERATSQIVISDVVIDQSAGDVIGKIAVALVRKIDSFTQGRDPADYLWHFRVERDFIA